MSVSFEWNDNLRGQIRDSATKGLQAAAEHLLAEALQLVPIAADGGTLARSGMSDVDKAALSASVSFDTVYAARQHEELTWRHAPGRQAKYLEQPFDTEQPTMLAMIAKTIEERLQ